MWTKPQQRESRPTNPRPQGGRTAEQKLAILRGPRPDSPLSLCKAAQKPQKPSRTYHQRGCHTKESKEAAATSPLLGGSVSLPLSKSCCLWRGSELWPGQALSPWEHCPVTCPVTAHKAWTAASSSNQKTNGQGCRHGAEPPELGCRAQPTAESFWN